MSDGPPMRDPVWELHIRPLFRLLDNEHMEGFGLFDYDTVRERHADILYRLVNRPMPPVATGGPWPPEWIDLFARWGKDFKRLRLLAPNAAGYQLRPGSKWSLEALVPVPGDGWRVWLDIASIGPEERVYTLYGEPGTERGPATEIPVRDRFTRSGSQRVIVEDANGRHTIPFP